MSGDLIDFAAQAVLTDGIILRGDIKSVVQRTAAKEIAQKVFSWEEMDRALRQLEQLEGLLFHEDSFIYDMRCCIGKAAIALLERDDQLDELAIGVVRNVADLAGQIYDVDEVLHFAHALNCCRDPNGFDRFGDVIDTAFNRVLLMHDGSVESVLWELIEWARLHRESSA